MDVFNFERIFLNEFPLSFLLETTFRTCLTFIVVLLFMRLVGRRGVKQLSIMELIVVLILGSAAGDAALNSDTPLLPAYLIFLLIVCLYRGVTHLIDKSTWVEVLMEGRSILIINKGEFVFEDMDRKNFSVDEILASLRQFGVHHLGQVQYSYLETDGNLSTFRYPENEVKAGCPILPFAREDVAEQLVKGEYFSCRFCSRTMKAESTEARPCRRCGRAEWLRAWQGNDILNWSKPDHLGDHK